MGGLVTWAKRWRRKWPTGRLVVPSTAGGVSSPMEAVGSLPAVAIGRSTVVTSSRVKPKVAWAATSRRSSVATPTGWPASTLCRCSATQALQGRLAASSSLIWSSVSSPRSGSTQSICPGPSRPRCTRPRPAVSTAPASEAHTTRPSSVASQRIGRSPLRSSAAPTRWPSVKTRPAGPSHGSVRQAW